MRRLAAWGILAVAVLAAGAMAARAGEAVGQPKLMLDTGGHMAMIRDIAFTPDGRQIVSASDDKVIRVWDVATGKTLRTIRGEAAPGHAGKVYAMALSPDGKWLAAGGVMDHVEREIGAIRLYDFASGRLVALLKGHGNVVFGLAFSPDGRHLISGSGGGDFTAIIWDVETKRLKHRLKGHRDDTYAVGFTADGARAVTGSYDHDLRLWSVASGEVLTTMTGHGDKVGSLAVAPDGRIASGDWSGEIRLWDGRTGRFLKTLARQKTDIGNLSFSPDGKWLLSTCGGGDISCATQPAYVWDTASGLAAVTYRGHDNAVIATAISPDGRWAATGGGANQELHIWDVQTGERRKGPDGQPLTLGGSGRPVWAVGVSADGRRIGWGHLWKQSSPTDRGPLEYALTLPAGDAPLTGPVAAGDGAFLRARAELNDWSLAHRKGGHYGYDAILDIKQSGRLVATIERGPTDGYAHRAYTFTPDGETVISGASNGVLTAYDRAGNKLGDFIGHEGDVWAVAPSPDGRYLVSGADDQTLRLWNLKTGELLVTLFRGRDGEWVMWTPQGYYAASAGGEKLIGWHVNRGPDKAADYFPAGQFRGQYYRPDIVALTAQLGNETRAIVRANEEAGRRQADAIKDQLPPVVTITAPANDSTFSGDSITVRYEVRSPSDLPVTRVRALIDGRPVPGAETKGFVPVRADAETSGKLDVTVPSRDVTLSLIAETGRATSVPAAIRLTWKGAAPMTGDDLRKPVLYALVAGVSSFKDGRISPLAWADVDARDFAKALEPQKGGLYRDVQIKLLVEAEATRGAIVDGFEWLKRSVSQGDVGVVFLSGHGATDASNNYYYVPHDAELDADAGLFLPKRSTAIPDSEILHTLKSLRGHALFFFDTCHAGRASGVRLKGQVDLRPFVNELRSAQNGVIVLASSDGSELSQERSDWKNGAFTYALKEGLAGKADVVGGGDGIVTVDELGLYVKERVKALTSGQQHPVETRPQETRNIPFAKVLR